MHGLVASLVQRGSVARPRRTTGGRHRRRWTWPSWNASFPAKPTENGAGARRRQTQAGRLCPSVNAGCSFVCGGAGVVCTGGLVEHAFQAEASGLVPAAGAPGSTAAPSFGRFGQPLVQRTCLGCFWTCVYCVEEGEECMRVTSAFGGLMWPQVLDTSVVLPAAAAAPVESSAVAQVTFGTTGNVAAGIPPLYALRFPVFPACSLSHLSCSCHSFCPNCGSAPHIAASL